MDSELAGVVDVLPGLVWSALPDGRVQFVNRRWREYTGLDLDQPSDADCQAAVHPEDLARWLERWRSMSTSEQPWELELRLRRFDGAYGWFLCRACPEVSASGQVVRWCGVSTDIDERRRVETTLRAIEANFSGWVESFPGLMVTMSTTGQVELFSREVLEYFGKTREELRTWAMTDAVHPGDLPRVVAAFTESITTGKPYSIEHRCRRADGVYRWFQVRGLAARDQYGQVTGWYVVLVDIDDVKRAEGALRESEREWRLIVDSIPGLIAVMTPGGNVEFVNRQGVEYFGRSLEELQRWGTGGQTHPEDLPRAVEHFTDAISSGVPWEVEVRARRFDGVYRWVQSRGFPLRDTNGSIVRWFNLMIDIDERKRAEDALRNSERQFRLLVETMPAVVWRGTPEGDLDYLNRKAVEYLGHTASSLSGGRWLELMHPDQREATLGRWLQSATAGSSYSDVYQIRRADGQYRWIQSVGEPLRDAEGRIANWYGLIFDIDDWKRAEEALAVSERNLKLTIDTIPALAWATGPDGSADFFNQHYLDFIGLSAEQASGWGWTAALHPDDLNGLAATWRRIMASEAPGEAEARLRRHDGEYRWFLFRASALRDESGAIVKWYGVNTDIEDRKRAEAELRRAYDSFADAQRLSHTGSFITDLVADDHNWSEETYRIFDFEPGTKVTVHRIRDMIHPDDLPSFDAMIARAMTGVDVNFYFRVTTSRGAVRHVRGVAHVIEQVEGRPMFVGAVQDVTESKVAEESLDRARSELAHVSRVTTLSTLTASIAHEVNQPLSGIITNAGTCLRMLDADPPNVEGARETARRTIRDGRRAADVIARLRALFSKKEFTLESFDLTEATREVIALALGDLQRNRITLQTELADDLPPVTADRVQLQQVILNLLRNASDAMADIEDRPRQLLVRTEREGGDGVRVTVRDTGVGVDPQSAGKLFDAFYTTKSGGMGVGLSVSRSIVERHHGRLWVEPNDGPGATFAFAIPCGPGGSVDAT